MGPVAPLEPSAAAEPEEASFSPKELALFAVHATRKNLVFCLLIALATGVLGTTIVAALPQYYDATCKIFVQEGGAVTSTLASGRERYRPLEGTRGLQEFILARDNLISIVREAKLVDKWPATRPLPMRLKDQFFLHVFGPPARTDMERGFAEMLTGLVTAAKDGESVRIHAQWRDRVSAYDIARLVQRNFLSARAAHDLGPIRRAIPFLEEQLQEADQEIDAAVRSVHTAKTQAAGVAALKAPEAAPPNPANDAAAAELASLSRQLSDNRRQQRALTEPRRRKIEELKVQLIDMSASYSPEHPLVRQQEARIATLSEVPEELAQLREKESQILSSLASRGVSRSASDAVAKTARPPSPDSPELAPLLARLGSALRKSDEMAARLENARIELATAEADFKHRYVVVEEPEVPNAPVKKKKPMLFALALVAAVLAGILAGALRELRKGRLVEPWQVRQLGIQLLGEVELK